MQKYFLEMRLILAIVFSGVVIFNGVVIFPSLGQEAPATTSPEVPRRAVSVDNAGKGGPTDPSENVKAVLEAGMKALADIINKETKRSDDLRIADEKLTRSELKRVDEILLLNAKHDLKISDLRGYYDSKIFESESKRIDALRASDAAANKEASTLALSSIKDITQQAFVASKDATSKSDTANDKRFDQLKSELGISLKGLDEKIVLLTNQNNLSAGKDAGTGTLLGGIGIVFGLLIAGATLVFSVTRKHPDVTPNLITIELLREMLKEKNGSRTS